MFKEIVKKFLKTHWVALIGVAVLSVCLKLALDYYIILSFPILLAAYFALGFLVELLMEQIAMYRGKTRTQTKTQPSRHPKVAESQNEPADDQPAQSQFQPQRPVRQKKNTPYYPQSGGIEKLERTRAQFVDLSPNDGDDVQPMSKAGSGSDFMIRTHQMYRVNQARNKGEGEDAPISAPAATPEHGDSASQIETVPVQPIVPPVSKPVQAAPVPPAAAAMKAAVPESPEPLHTTDDIEQMSDDLTKEIDKRIEASLRTVSRRRKDYSFEQTDGLPVSQEPRVVSAKSHTAPADHDLPQIKPVLFKPLPEEPIVQEPQRETNYQDDKVHADRSMINALFEMSHQQETAHPAPVRRPVTAQTPRARVQAPASSIPTPVAYDIPSVDLLRGGRMGARKETDFSADQDPRAQKLIDTLASFGVGAKVTAVIKGPAVTRYEIQPNPGVKVSRIVSLADDISLNLAATGVRIEAPIPGKEAVGIEVPNREVEIVYLKDVIDSREYKEAKSNLTFAIGKDIAGTNIVHDIAKMPHLLIAGATGAGKSVCINTIIASILYKAGPDQVRMIMIDPKIVELGVYNGIPHLLVPVVTNPKKAAAALAWAVGEMERRYSEFSQYNVRDIRGYNELAARRKTMTHMPQIVIIIDELADLMMVAAKEIEDSIIRLAQKARAAGLHIIIATQRPSVDVITGLIKANIPSRIAFAVSSQVDSRTILDGAGAEKLLGRGDMLFHPIGMSKPLRVQGAFVSDGEIEALVAEIKRKCGAVQYSEEIQATMEAKMNAGQNNSSGTGSAGGDDEDCDTAVIQAAAELAFEFKQLSTSFLQRKLKLGYSRASRVVDALERAGLISAADGSKPRQLLMTREEWNARQ